MNMKTILKIFICLILGMILYFIIEGFIGEIVIAMIVGEDKGNDDMFPFYWLLLIVGGIIATTLSYVSWRKYKGEKNETHVKNNDK